MKLTSRGINVLGSPVGNGEFTHDFVMSKVHKNKELLREIEALGDLPDRARKALSPIIRLVEKGVDVARDHASHAIENTHAT